MADKQLIWLGSSRSDLRAFPELARRLTGFQLRLVQRGLDPHDWKPMPAIGPGVREIRVHIEGANREFYVATLADAVYVLHAFQKKTRKTAGPDLESRASPIPISREAEAAAWQTDTPLG